MKIHKLKLYEEFCDDVLEGRKNFEVRLNDRGYQCGDIVEFISFRGGIIPFKGCIIDHPLKDEQYKITYVLSGNGIKEDYVVFGIKNITEDK